MDLSNKFETLEGLGFQTPKWQKVSKSEIPVLYQEWDKARAEYDIDVDGIVFMADSEEEFQSLGWSSDRLKPNAGIALKWAPETQAVTIKQVEFSQEGGHAITMVAVFDPVTIDGAEITRASLKSYRWVRENGIGIGSVVELKRSGMVIPCITSVISNSEAQPIQFPEVCPVCGSPIDFSEANMACTNFNCEAKEANRIVTFLTAVGVKGLGSGLALRATTAGLKLRDFVAKDFDRIQNVVESTEGLSKVIFDKIISQLK